jgi:hypothetical protein
MEALIRVTTLGGPTMFVLIGVPRAQNRHVERVSNPPAKILIGGAAQCKSLDLPKQFAKNGCGFRGTGALYEMDPLSFRFRYFLVIVLAAVVTAAALRHIVHVYVGLSREEIRTAALIATPLVAIAIIFFQRKRRP